VKKKDPLEAGLGWWNGTSAASFHIGVEVFNVLGHPTFGWAGVNHLVEVQALVAVADVVGMILSRFQFALKSTQHFKRAGVPYSS
jgi:hypothetical protein